MLHPPAAAATGRNGQPLLPSAASIGGIHPWYRPTPHRFHPGSVGLVLSDQRQGRGNIHIALLRAGATRLTGEPLRQDDPTPGLKSLTILAVDWDGELHVLHYLLSVPVGPYNSNRSLFGC